MASPVFSQKEVKNKKMSTYSNESCVMETILMAEAPAWKVSFLFWFQCMIWGNVAQEWSPTAADNCEGQYRSHVVYVRLSTVASVCWLNLFLELQRWLIEDMQIVPESNAVSIYSDGVRRCLRTVHSIRFRQLSQPMKTSNQLLRMRPGSVHILMHKSLNHGNHVMFQRSVLLYCHIQILSTT